MRNNQYSGLDPIQPKDKDMVKEMEALIKFAENTDCKEIRLSIKTKLKQLSQIPLINEWGIGSIKHTNNG